MSALKGLQVLRQRQLGILEAFPDLGNRKAPGEDSASDEPKPKPFGPQPHSDPPALGGGDGAPCPSLSRVALVLLRCHPTAMFGSAVSSGVSLLPSSGRLDAGLRTGIYPEAGRDSNRCTGTHAAAGPDDAPCTSGRGDGTGAAAWSSRASSRGSQRLGRAKRLPWAHLAAREQAAAARLAEAAEARAQLLTYLPDVERDVALDFEIYSDGSFFSADGAGSSRLSCAPAGADLYEPSLYGDDYNLYAGRQEAWLRRYDSGRGRLRGLDVNDDEGFQEFNSCDGDVLDLERGGQTAGGSERGGSEGDVFSSDTESLYEWLTHISDALLEAEEELSSGRWFGRGSRGGVGVPARPLPPAPWAPAEREEVVQEAVALATQRCLLKAAVLPLDRLIKEYGADVDRWAKEAGDQAVIAGGETEQEQKRLLLRAKQQRREAAELFKSSMRTRLQLTRSCNAKTAAYEMLLEGPRGEQIGIDADITDFRLAVQRLEVICELLQRKTGKGSGGSGGSSETVARFEELCAVLMAAVTDEDGPERLRWRVLMDAATRATGAAKHTAIVALNWALLGCVQIIAGCLIADGSPLHELGPLDPVTAAAAAACYEYASLSASEAGVAEQVYYSAEQFYAMLHMGPLPPIALQVRTDLLPATAASPPQPQPLPQPLSAEHLNSTAMRSMFHTLSTYGWLGYLHLVGRDGDNNAVSEEELIAAEDELFGCELVDYVLWQQQSQQSQLISTGDADTVSGSGDEGECAASPQPQQGLPRSAVAGPGPGPAAGPSTATRRSAAAAAAPPAGAATAVSAVSSSSGGGGGSREPRQGLLEVAAAWDALPPPPAALQAQAVALLAATREVLALMEQPMRVLPAEVGATTAGKGPGWSLGPPPEAPAGAAGDGESEVRCRLRLEGPELVAALAMLLADGQALADYRKGSGAGQLQTLWLPVGNPPASASAVSGATSTGAQRAGQQHGPQQQQLQHGIEVEFVRCLGFSARETLGGGSTTLMEERKLRLSNNIVQVTDKLKPADAAKQAHKVLKEYGACYMHGKGAGGVLRVLQALARVRQDMRQAGGGGRDVAALVTETVHYGDADVLNECRKATTPAPAAAGQHAGTGASQQQQKQKHQPAYAGQEGEAAEPLDDWSLQACVDEFAVNVEILERGPVGSCGSDADLELELQLGRLVERLAWRVLLPLLPPPPPQQGQRGSGGGGGGDGGGSNTPVACEAGSSDVVLWLEQVYQLIGGAKHREGRDEARWLIDHAVGSARKELVVEFLVLTCSPGHPTEFYLAPGVAAAAQKKLKEEKMTKDVAVIDRL